MQRQLLLLELNEINFDHVAFYCDRGLLPNFERILSRHGRAFTQSETQYEQLEPWIQWVTAHTGRSFAEHGVFRLGDIVKHDMPQIWERLEDAGLRVGAISPMNAKHRLRDPAFFVPDPWTVTELTARPPLRRLYAAIARAVSDNAQARLTPSTFWNLFAGLLYYASPRNYGRYVHLGSSAPRSPWRKAILLDLLLADVFIHEAKRTQPQFASLFVNAGAHIQHHYMFSAACYTGSHRNPEWYLRRGADPVAEVYTAYDTILGQVCDAFPDARIMLATGLHQDPHGEVTFYWRLRHHAEFLKKIGVPFARVEALMSRDFRVECTSPAQARQAQERLRAARAADGTPLFEVDNRGADLFVMLTYPSEIGPGFTFGIGSESYSGLERDVAFVALKNGQHNGTGYFVDTGTSFCNREVTFPLKELPQRVMEALSVSTSALSAPQIMPRSRAV
jgi:hypothetical protein